MSFWHMWFVFGNIKKRHPELSTYVFVFYFLGWLQEYNLTASDTCYPLMNSSCSKTLPSEAMQSPHMSHFFL